MARFPIVARNDPDTILEAVVSPLISEAEFMATDIRWSTFKEAHLPPLNEPPLNQTWQWRRKVEQTTPEDHGFLSLKFAGEIEGLAMFSLHPVPSRKEHLRGHLVMYVEYLESAPWNQRDYAGKNTRFWGVGTSLISALIEKSEQMGCGGRLALHSLEGAKPFYADQGFENIGFDEEEGFEYFELSGTVLEEGKD